MKRRVLLSVLGALGYLSIGVVVGIDVYRHQAARFDPGFDPLVSGVIAVIIWPTVLAGSLRR